MEVKSFNHSKEREILRALAASHWILNRDVATASAGAGQTHRLVVRQSLLFQGRVRHTVLVGAAVDLEVTLRPSCLPTIFNPGWLCPCRL